MIKLRKAHFVLVIVSFLFIAVGCRFANQVLQPWRSSPVPITTENTPQQLTSIPVRPSPEAVDIIPPTVVPELTDEEVLNTEYCFPFVAEEHERFEEISPQGCFRLVNGQFGVQDATDPNIMFIAHTDSTVVYGDLDGDDDRDAIVVMGFSHGGSGFGYSVVSVLNDQGVPKHSGEYVIGPNVTTTNISFEGKVLLINFIGHGAQDPMCCPTQPMSVSLVFRNGNLVDAVAEQVGPYADQALAALKNRDMPRLAQLVHPQWGVRFSPYSYVLEDHRVFTAGALAGLMQDATVFQWGNYDGSGEPILLTFSEYFDRFVYSMDFANAPQTSFNQRLGYGNTLDNSREFYPGGVVVEYYFPGQDPQYGGMDWHSLRLVFLFDGERWYLVGVINDEWTI